MNKVLLMGSGGREHAIAKALKDGGAKIYAVMKHKNPGIARLSEDYIIGDDSSVSFVKNLDWVKFKKVDFAVIGPEAPLINGMADMLEEKGIPVVGPRKDAAIIEGSKEFMRDLMKKHNIDGMVDYYVFNDPQKVEEFLKNYDKPFVIKPVGVTGGKGVWVMGDHFKTKEDGIRYAKEIIEKKIGGVDRVIIEEKLVGEEFTLQIFTDGINLAGMPLVQDFKRAYEGDLGPNTGGMGSYSMENHLLPFLTKEDYTKAMKIMEDIIAAMRREGRIYKGIIYGQFMLTAEGPKIIEVNCRFGDPEAMNVLSILKTNFVDIAWSIIEGKLKPVEFENKATVVKYVVPEGYGTKPLANQEIKVNEERIKREGALLYYASVNESNGKIYTTTSRSLAVVGIAENLYEAEEIAEKALRHIVGRVYSRHDIAKKEMIDAKIAKMKELRGI
ncbi:phosphoribosylamine--glycine ligase [Candidatus Aciduliprofundum boonei]|uniref:Phosphoribosylamine--glycine ligase n=1 Tax=Aciduliprofundum boonei (strain DSM 19572 / T469) TaxID=439481 RepID=D3T9Y0_ACIB4|nr:phosphoribosylamine--glycine ligase [Candidatus Aciduliprofundum boonei]ADD08909.1 phosphoribosylamine/glycine ligase [Aciduliprofundum boonei T469]HII54776.1 phosphoribosylamine--glycine ligase [Candidatus Aciduliprofundum boonei]